MHVAYGKADATKDWLASILQARDNVRIPDVSSRRFIVNLTDHILVLS